MIEGFSRSARHEVERAYAMRDARENSVSRSERRLANQVCNLSGNGLVHSDNGFSTDENREVMDLELYRRLKFDFVQESKRRKIEEVDEWLIMDNDTIFVRTVAVPVSLEGRITRRKHNNWRRWKPDHEDRTARSVLNASRIEISGMIDSHWVSDRLLGEQMGVVRAGKRDWRRLHRSNASCPEPTLKSVMPPQLIEMGSKK